MGRVLLLQVALNLEKPAKGNELPYVYNKQNNSYIYLGYKVEVGKMESQPSNNWAYNSLLEAPRLPVYESNYIPIIYENFPVFRLQ